MSSWMVWLTGLLSSFGTYVLFLLFVYCCDPDRSNANIITLFKIFSLVYTRGVPMNPAPYVDDKHPEAHPLWRDLLRNVSSRPESGTRSLESEQLPAWPLSSKDQVSRSTGRPMSMSPWYQLKARGAVRMAVVASTATVEHYTEYSPIHWRSIRRMLMRSLHLRTAYAEQ